MVDIPMQINDRYEFPLELDLDRENGKYLSPDADRSVRNLYTLHRYCSSILISSTNLDKGCCYPTYPTYWPLINIHKLSIIFAQIISLK